MSLSNDYLATATAAARLQGSLWRLYIYETNLLLKKSEQLFLKPRNAHTCLCGRLHVIVLLDCIWTLGGMTLP